MQTLFFGSGTYSGSQFVLKVGTGFCCNSGTMLGGSPGLGLGKRGLLCLGAGSSFSRIGSFGFNTGFGQSTQVQLGFFPGCSQFTCVDLDICAILCRLFGLSLCNGAGAGFSYGSRF